MLSKRWIKPVSSQQNVIIATLVIIGMIGLYNRVITPHRNYLQAAQKFEAAADNLTKKKQTIANNLKIRKKELAGLEEQLNSGFEMLFESIEAKEFFNNIQAVSEKTGCIMYSLTFSQTDSESGINDPNANIHITTKGAKVTILGGYDNITALMNKLQENSKCVRIESVKIYSDSSFPDYLKCEMSVTIYITSRKEVRRHET
jgi:Tfp pilus assembly protein PilO